MKHSHVDSSSLNLNNPEYKNLVDFYLYGEMERDSGNGDITTSIILSSTTKIVKANIIAKSKGIMAGKAEVAYFLNGLNITHTWGVNDGDKISKKQHILNLQGEARLILKIERVILNFLGRMSGVATTTNLMVQKIPPSILLCPTRKTLWGLLDKKAVVIGGGGTHRLSLSSAFLAKENHLSLLKNRQISELLPIFKNLSVNDFGQFCEIEVENKNEAKTAVALFNELKLPSAIIMLDNFTPTQIKLLLPSLKKIITTNILFEASGGINMKNINRYAKTGVNIISMGSITHSASNFDFSMRIIG